MVPLIELRGAIPIGVGLGLDLVPTILLCILGNMIPVPFIILFIRKIFALMRRLSPKLDGIVVKMENKAYSKKEILDKYKALGLYILVAIPLPGTGAWTGSLVAALFDIRLKTAFPIIFAGVATAGLIIGLITGGVVALI
ncbi:MAG: small multi-drug export protein [Oscillospiraceae bacterium]|nr:small multi-drug export protein [Oscillospiraceae bacterium]